MTFPMPRIEITHEIYLSGIGGPNSKMDTFFTVNLNQVRPHFFIGSLMASFTHQVAIKIC
jgi:hypothetical protein